MRSDRNPANSDICCHYLDRPVNTDYGDFIYPYPDCPPFYKDGSRDADNAAKPDPDWAGAVFNGIYHVAGIFENQHGSDTAALGG